MVLDGQVLEFQLNSFFVDPSNRGLNVFHYVVAEFTGTHVLSDIGQELGFNWFDTAMAGMLPVLSVQVAFDGGIINNLDDPPEFGNFIIDPVVGGQVAGDVLPPFASYGFILKRTNRTTRNGYKRFWGIPESAQVDGIAITSVQDVLDDAADVFEAPIELTGTDDGGWSLTLIPVIVRKDAAGLISLFQQVNGVEYRAIGTQNTRKFGRGM